MATTTAVPLKLGECLTNKEINFGSDVFKGMLCTVTYVFAQNTHKYKSDVTNECSGSGYTAGGVSLGTITGPTDDATTKQARFSAVNLVFATASISNARQCVIYDSTPSTDATRPIIAVVNFGADKDLSSGGLTIIWDATGFFATQAV